jgi:hypothetical protein
MKEEKCLVIEAQNKCKCSWCKMARDFRDLSVKQNIQMEINRRMYEITSALRLKNLIKKSKSEGRK